MVRRSLPYQGIGRRGYVDEDWEYYLEYDENNPPAPKLDGKRAKLGWNSTSTGGPIYNRDIDVSAVTFETRRKIARRKRRRR